MTRLRLVKESGFPERLNLNTLLRETDVPWDISWNEAKSRELFAKVMVRVDDWERRRRWMTRVVSTASVAAVMLGTYQWFN